MCLKIGIPFEEIEENKELVEKELYSLIELLNKEYELRTISSCAGHIGGQPPFVLVDIPIRNLEYLMKAVDEFEVRREMVDYYNEGEFLKEQEIITIKNLDLEIDEDEPEDNPIKYEGLQLIFRGKKRSNTEEELKKQQEEFNNNVRELMEKYKYFKHASSS